MTFQHSLTITFVAKRLMKTDIDTNVPYSYDSFYIEVVFLP